MRKIIIMFIGALILALAVDCSNKLAYPKIELSTNYFDFEDINPNKGLRTETFFIKNIGDAPLKIVSVSTSCGCTEAEVEEEDIGPGKQTELIVTYDPSVHPNLTGPIKRIVYVQSNDPLKEEVELELAGNIIGEYHKNE